MYWGNSLLLFDWGKNAVTAMQEFAYKVWTLVPYLLYQLWKLLAWIVSGVEGIFRNLAGLGTSGDIVSDIIGNGNVQQIFGNLVGLSTALIIFFTIVKIIQEHYKEKDGGNPYKIVLRTFKGLLMFFFVSAAVTVGLYASGVMFRALDAATGGGNATIAGQVFKAMASDANRKRFSGEETSDFFFNVEKKYYKRMTDASSDDGVYFLAQVGDAGKSQSTNERVAKYLQAFPSMQYGVVGSDGVSLTPVATWLKTYADEENNDPTMEDKYRDAISNNFNVVDGDSWGGVDEFKWSDTGVSGDAGYHGDILRGTELQVQPSISLTWSPIDIVDYTYHLEEIYMYNTNIDISVLGSGTSIPMTSHFLNFVPEAAVQKSMEDSAKLFGISLNGGVSLQGSEAAMSFSFEAYDPKKFRDIFQTITVNVVYTNLLKMVIEHIPTFPAIFSIGPLGINLVSAFAPLLCSIMSVTINSALEDLIPQDEYGNPTVVAFSTGASSSNAGIWSIINQDSKFLNTTIEQYRIDGNFSDLWGQLMDNFDQFKKFLETGYETGYSNAYSQLNEVDKLAMKVSNQSGWRSYMARVNEYNDFAASSLTKLGNLFELYDAASLYTTDETRNDYLTSQKYDRSYSGLEEDIKSTWKYLVGYYNSAIYHQRPTDCYADVRLTYPVYKPIVEFGMSDNMAADLSVENIRNALMNAKLDSQDKNIVISLGNRTATVNLLIDDINRYSSAKSAYRMIDWSAYGPAYNDDFEGRADLYISPEDYEEVFDDSEEGKQALTRKILANTDYATLAKLNLDETGSDNWAEQGGIAYFVNGGNTFNTNNSFTQHALSYVDSSQLLMINKSYWSLDGIMIGKNATLHEYNGKNKSLTSSSVSPSAAALQTSNVRGSSVNSNALLAQAAAATDSLFADGLTMHDDTPSEATNEFAKNIVTFRKLGTAAENSSDIKALKDWIKSNSSLAFDGTIQAKTLPNMSVSEIDDVMATTDGSSGRRYLCKTKAGSDVNDQTNYSDYVGVFSYEDAGTVRVLYRIQDMNFAVGFIAIISAVGVYLNFVFALVQRAVNMAVLYVMSPITIAFYPFDDGQKFNSGFVSPFYKEAISAFAVIVSLNLFVVLMSPVEKAVEAAAGTVMSWIALVAFVSMLPNIRDSICSLLGAGKMSGKSLTDTFKAAGGVLAQPFNDIKGLNDMRKNAQDKASQKLAGGLGHLRNIQDSYKAKKELKRNQEIEKLEALKRDGKATDVDIARLAKLKARDTSQKRIDDARLQLANATTDAQREAALQGLSRSERRRLKRQDKAAVSQASKNIDRNRFGKDAAGEAEYQKALKAEQNRLLQDSNFKKSVNGVVSATALRVKNSRIGGVAGAAAYSLSNSWLGAAVGYKYGVDGLEAQKGKGLVHEFWASKNIKARDDYKKDLQKKMIEREAYRRKPDQDAFGAVTKAGGEMMNAESDLNKAATQSASEKLLNNYGLKEQLIAAKIADNLKDGKMTADQAKQAAEKDVNDLLTNASGSLKDQYLAGRTDHYMSQGLDATKAADAALVDYERLRKTKNANKNIQNSVNAMHNAGLGVAGKALSAELEKMGGISSLAAGITSGKKEYSNLGINIDLNSDLFKQTLASEMANLQEKYQGRTANSMAAELKQLEEGRQNSIEQHAVQLAQAVGADDNQQTLIKKVLKSADKDTTLDQIVQQISGDTGLNDSTIRDAFKNQFNHFNNQLQSSAQENELNSMMSYVQQRDKARKDMFDKLGPDVPTEAVDEYLNKYIELAGDMNINSTNPNSVGYQINQIIKQYPDGENNPECKRRVEETRKEFGNKWEAYFESFMDKYRETIRNFDLNKKAVEDMRGTSTAAIMTEIQKQREYEMSVNVDVKASELLVNDSLIQKLHAAGDYAGAGRRMQVLIAGVQNGDDSAYANLGFDAETIEKLKKWQAEGGDAANRLKGLYSLARFDAANMGSTMVNMGGSSIEGMQASFAQLTRIAEIKTINEKLKIAATSYQNEEQAALQTSKRVLASIETTFSDDFFDKMKVEGKFLMGTDGQPVKTAEEFRAALVATINKVGEGNENMHDPMVVANQKIMNEWKNMKGDNVAIVGAVDNWLSGVYNTSLANNRSEDAQAVKNKLSALDAEIREIVNKLGKN